MRTTIFALAALLLASLTVSSGASAQTLSNQGRDCQTVRTCNFARNAEVRGCLSSYTCRTCKMVPASCSITGAQGPCQRMRCTWGG